MKTQLVTTDRLETGDRVLCHGRVFRLLTRNAAEGRTSEKEIGPARPVIWFTTELLETLDPTLMPQDWATHWTVQGNERASWRKIIAQCAHPSGCLNPARPGSNYCSACTFPA